MKKILNIALALLATTAIWSCAKDGEMIKVTLPDGGADPLTELHASTLTKSEEDNLALTITWGSATPDVSNPNVALPDDIIETSLQFSLSESFDNIYQESVESGALSRQYTVGELNEIMIKVGATESTAYNLYVRLSQLMGDNREPQYSKAFTLNVTPFMVDMTILKLVEKDDHTAVVAEIQSGADANLYEGFVTTPSSWFNFYFLAGDGTLWGTETVTWVPFSLTDDQAGNCWFGDTSGVHYVYANTEAMEWSAIHIPTLNITIGAESVAVSRKDGEWSSVFTTTEENSVIKIGGTGSEYNQTTGDSNPAPYQFSFVGSTNGSFSFVQGDQPSTIVAAKSATTYTLTLNPTTMEWRLEEGGETPPTEEYPAMLYAYYYIKDGDTKLSLASTMAPIVDADGTYESFITTDPSWSNSSLSNFRFLTTNDDTATVYGSAQEGQYILSGNGWNCWSSTPGLNHTKVDLTTKTWSETSITSIAVTGDFNDWSLTANQLTLDAATGVWSAVCDIQNIGYGIQVVLGDWAWKYGKSTTDGKLAPADNNNNIIPAEVGKYLLEVTFDDFNNPTYKITKQ